MKTIYLLPFVILFFLGCSNTQTEYIETVEFMKQVQEIEEMNSAYKTTYIGSTDSRVYLEYYTAITSMRKGKTIIYWTKLKDLSEEQLKKITKRRSQ